jgi:hypothetical protein
MFNLAMRKSLSQSHPQRRRVVVVQVEMVAAALLSDNSCVLSSNQQNLHFKNQFCIKIAFKSKIILL